MLADFERTVVTEWGVRRDDVPGYSGMPTRSVFIVDREQVIRWTWVRTKEIPLPDYDEVIREAERIAPSG